MFKRKNLVIAVIAILIVVAGVFWLSGNRSDTPTDTEEPKQVIEVGTPTELSTDEKDEIAVNILDNSLTKSVTLNDVTEGTSTGTAYVLRDEAKLYHMVNASLPEPEDGLAYEGWLVKKNPELMFVSTGVMQSLDDDIFTLLFMSDNQYDGYDDVVITLETVVDETPEEHILEGTIE